jgi:hypothetical protein
MSEISVEKEWKKILISRLFDEAIELHHLLTIGILYGIMAIHHQ